MRRCIAPLLTGLKPHPQRNPALSLLSFYVGGEQAGQGPPPSPPGLAVLLVYFADQRPRQQIALGLDGRDPTIREAVHPA
jgi:hypothetical protein